jgi:thiamine thiazole synthase
MDHRFIRPILAGDFGVTIHEKQITRAILTAFHKKILSRIESDVIVAGAGPSGLTAALYLSEAGLKVTVVDRALAAGGGIWGGGMAMNEIVVDAEALPILRKVRVSWKASNKGLYTLDACELASALCYAAIRAKAVVFNLTTVEDLCVRGGRVNGVVINRALISKSFPVDPVMLTAKAVIDATGHEAALARYLAKRGLLKGKEGGGHFMEWPMCPSAGEKFVVEKTGEIFPGLWVAGMSAAAVFGGPRMGPIFKGMLVSGRCAANQMIRRLKRGGGSRRPRRLGANRKRER